MLEKLFTSKNRIKILELFLFKNNISHIRKISNELKIPVSAVKRETDNLIAVGLINKEKNQLILNKDSFILPEIKNLFIKTDYIIYPLKEALQNKKIKFVFIFGSFARGSYEKESDIDLFIIGELKLSEIYNLLKPVEEKTKREINPVVWTVDNLKKEKNSGFLNDIFKKEIIMVKGDEDELRKVIE